MDLVTENLLESFKKQQSFPDQIEKSVLFEHFVNYCITANEYDEEFDLESIHVAGGNDLQLDGVVILLNGVLINTIDEIDDLVNTNKYAAAEFIFIQSKTGREFKGSEISEIFFGIRELISKNPQMPRNDALKEKERLIKYIYTKSEFFKYGNPRVKIYYVTTGKWVDDEKLISRIKMERDNLDELTIFDSINFYAIDARRLQNLYSRAKNNLTKTFIFSNKVTLPLIEGIREAYLGYIPVSEYIKLISDENGNLIRGLFTDNVRDYQGDNPVNMEIESTLKSPDKQAFVVLNNGVTIVSDELKITGDRFTLTGFQIVNGCQTSHVLFNNKENLDDSVHIPVKLIVAPDNAIKNKVIKATNRQTTVKIEELSALTDFQKHLEEYYSAIRGKHQLYYERRSQQYRADVGIEKIRIVNIPSQLRSFASMFLKRAHQASRYYGTLLKDIGSKVFVEGHPPIAYYISSYTLFRIEWFMRRNQVDNKYRSFKYHLLGIIRMQLIGVDLYDMKSRKFEKSCEKIRDIIWDDDECLNAILNACALLENILDGDFNRDRAKDSSIQDKAAEIIARK